MGAPSVGRLPSWPGCPPKGPSVEGRVRSIIVRSSARPRVGIVTTDAYAEEDLDHDTPLLLAALRERGVEAEALVWHDGSADLAAYGLLLIRSPWDYPVRLAEFLAWLDRAEAATRVLNDPATVR